MRPCSRTASARVSHEVEYKVNFLSPARGERLLARGWVVKPGRTLTVCAGEVHALSDGTETIVATMLATMMSQVVSSSRPAP